MGGDVGTGIAQAATGFMQGYAEQAVNQKMQQKAQQDQFAMQGAAQLAQKGELGSLPEDILKGVEKRYGKDGFAALQQQNQLNQVLRQVRRGAEQFIQQRPETTMQPVSPMEILPTTPQGNQLWNMQQTPGQPGAEQVSPISEPVTTMKQASPQEQFQAFNEIGPLGVYLLTGDVNAGQLAQRQQQLAFDSMKYAEAPKRNAFKTIVDQQAKWAGENRRSFVTTSEQLNQLQNTGNVPEGFVGFQIGNAGVLVEAPNDAIEISEKVQTQLAAQGVRDVREATTGQIQKALKDSIKTSSLLAGAGARAKEIAARQMANGARLADVSRQRYEDTFDRVTGQLPPASLTVGEADDKRWKVLPPQHKKVLQDVQQSRATLETVIRDFQKLYGKGGELANVKSTLPSRTVEGAKAAWARLTQQNPTLASLSAQAGQLAQALNRGSFGGVGTQTENDRKYAMRALTSISDGSFLLDTPKVQQKKINDVMRRFNRIEGTILGNAGKDFPGSIYMDITKPADALLEWATPPITFQEGETPNAPTTQPAEQIEQATPETAIPAGAPSPGVQLAPEIATFEAARQNFPGLTPERYNEIIGQLTGKKKTLTAEGIELLGEFEGRRAQVYDDATGQPLEDISSARGFPTIGVGHLLTDEEKNSGTIDIGGERVSWQNGLSDEQINQLAQQDAEIASNIVDKYVDVDLTPQQRDALISFAFNIGEGNFKNAGAIKALNRGDIDDFVRRHAQWNKSRGEVMSGLTRRRQEEAKLFLSGLENG